MKEDVERNRAYWNRLSRDYQRQHGAFIGHEDPRWGVFQISEDELQVLGDVAGKDVLELGCGAAQWSMALAKRGANMTGIDLSSEQLAQAREAVAAASLEVQLLECPGHAVPLPDRSFDIVFCDHGAMSFADPYTTVPEVARLLRRGGIFAFSHNAPLLEMCWPPDAKAPSSTLQRGYAELRRMEDEGAITFQLSYGEWIRLFRGNRLAVLDLIELGTPRQGTTTYYPTAVEWGRRWPIEQIWKLAKE